MNAALDLVVQLEAAAAGRFPRKPDEHTPEITGRPTVDTSSARPVLTVVRDLLEHLADRFDVFVHGTGLVQAVNDEGRVMLRLISEGRLLRVVGEMCDPLDGKGQHAALPRAVTQALLAWDGPPLRLVEGVTATPIMRPDASIVTEPGYEPGTRLIYAPPAGFRMPAVPDEPSEADVEQAIQRLDDALADFAFAEPVDRAGAIGLIITPNVRTLARPPLHALDAPVAGSGKGLLMNLASVIATGHEARVLPWPESAEEQRKPITSILREGVTDPVLFDEARRIEGGPLSALLTDDWWTDRILGASRIVTLPNRPTWGAAGNNLVVRGDMARRVSRIRLDPDHETPSTRPAASFRHHPLLAWARANRPGLLRSVLTLVRAWVNAGSPAPTVTMGSFDAWVNVVGGVLELAGVEDFLVNQYDVLHNADPDVIGWEILLDKVRAHYEATAWTTRGLVGLIHSAGWGDEGWLPSDLAEVERTGYSRMVAYALRSKVDRRFGKHRLMHGGETREKFTMWRIERVLAATLA